MEKCKTKAIQANLIKFPTAHGKLNIVFPRFINAVVTEHVSSIAEYGCVAISNNFTFGSGITQHASTNSVCKHSLKNVQICLSFELTERNA